MFPFLNQYNRHCGQFDSFAQQLADVLSTVKKITVKNCELQVPMFLLLFGKPGLVEMNIDDYAHLPLFRAYPYPNLPTRNHNPTLTKLSITDSNVGDFYRFQLAKDSMAKLKEFEFMNRMRYTPNLLSVNRPVLRFPELTKFTHGLLFGNHHKRRYRFLLSPRFHHLRSVTLIESRRAEFNRSKARLCKDFNIYDPVDEVDENGDLFTVFEIGNNRKITLNLKRSIGQLNYGVAQAR